MTPEEVRALLSKSGYISVVDNQPESRHEQDAREVGDDLQVKLALADAEQRDTQWDRRVRMGAYDRPPVR